MLAEFKDSILKNVKNIYFAFSEIAVYISSFLFFSLFFANILNRPNFFNEALLPVAILLALYSYSKSKVIEQIVGFLGKLITISGSIFVLTLFLNSYFKISDFLNKIFVTVWDELESSLNEFVFAGVFLIMIMVIFFYFINFLLELARDKIKGRLSDVLSVLIVLFLALSVGFSKYLIPSLDSLSMNVYSEVSFLVSFSLIFLHTDYLVKEIKKFKKVAN
ncbi:MAG: hypothetical protein ABH919_02110 [bacterium]